MEIVQSLSTNFCKKFVKGTVLLDKQVTIELISRNMRDKFSKPIKNMLQSLHIHTSNEEFKEEKNYKVYIDKQQLTNNLIHSV